MIAKFIKSLRINAPITTKHAEARKIIAHHRAMSKRSEEAVGVLAKSEGELHRLRSGIIALREKQIAREEAVLAGPNEFRFPTFFSFTVGKNDFGISLAGLRCNFPSLARKYGEECEVAGNTLHYKNWLGHHWDF